MLTALAMAASMAACGDKKTDETAADSTEVAMTEAGTESTEAETESEEVLPEGMYRSELTNELIDESLKNQRPIAVMRTMSLLHCHITVYHRQTLSMR